MVSYAPQPVALALTTSNGYATYNAISRQKAAQMRTCAIKSNGGAPCSTKNGGLTPNRHVSSRDTLHIVLAEAAERYI